MKTDNGPSQQIHSLGASIVKWRHRYDNDQKYMDPTRSSLDWPSAGKRMDGSSDHGHPPRDVDGAK